LKDVTVEKPAAGPGPGRLRLGPRGGLGRLEPYIEQAEVQDGARVLVNGTPVGKTFAFEVASRAALADPAKAAAIRAYLKLINQAHAWANTHQACGRPRGRRPPACRAASWPGRPRMTRRRSCRSTRRVRSEQSISDAFSAAGLIPGHVNFAQLRGHDLQQHGRSGFMTLVFHWFLPTSGDGRAIVGRGTACRWPARRPAGGRATGAWSTARPPDIDYLAQIAAGRRAGRLHRGC